MTITPPAYFEAIRENAAKRWVQLQADPELAGLRHLVFTQVQSPRYVVSELLQNADDAEAHEATVTLGADEFLFTHDGRDFSDEEFASLCRFGYSNKRTLHTIGFRGIGFKSTFSLGDVVELSTPTLSVAFNKESFTEPIWIERDELPDGTEIRVKIATPERREELDQSFAAWLQNPIALLFFKHLKRLRIGSSTLEWNLVAPGPTPNSRWFSLAGSDMRVLVGSSNEEPFPAEALAEVKEERMLALGDSLELPPCKVDIVLKATGALYAVLPTGIRTSLPFACNAPFMQDPARNRIKDPELSFTNTWLLRRVGELAANVMRDWLQNEDLTPAARAESYELLPNVIETEATLEGACTTSIGSAFHASVEDDAIILTEDCTLTERARAVVLPNDLLDVWPDGQAARILDGSARPALSRHVSPPNRRKLVDRRLVVEKTRADVMDVLERSFPPRPTNWRRLAALWNYLEEGLSKSRSAGRERNLRIVPVRGRNTLHSPTEVVRLAEKRVLQSDEDWHFVSQHLKVVDPKWPRYLTDQRRAQSKDQSSGSDMVEGALGVLTLVGLHESTPPDALIDQVAKSVCLQEPPVYPDLVRLAQIAAKLRVSIREGFRYATADGQLRSRDHCTIWDRDGTVSALLPSDWRSEHVLHSAYGEFRSCSQEEWERWVASGNAWLHRFPSLEQTSKSIWGKTNLGTLLRARGSRAPEKYPYKGESFQLKDWDFADSILNHWTEIASNDDQVWPRVLEYIFAQRRDYWSKAQAVTVSQSSSGYTKPVPTMPAAAAWVHRLRSVPCLRDRNDCVQKPADLLRLTEETQSYLDVADFVAYSLDNEASRDLLDLLGVGAKSPGSAVFLDRLRRLRASATTSKQDVVQVYFRMEQVWDVWSTAEVAQVEEAFREDALILTEGGEWTSSTVVRLSDETDVPDNRVVLAACRDLKFWNQIGVAQHSTPEHALEWLRGISSNTSLTRDELRRIEPLLSQIGDRIWTECGHWLTLANTWAPVESIRYSYSMASMTRWSDLYEWVRQQTADLRRVGKELLNRAPFNELTPLADCIEERISEDELPIKRDERQPWLTRLGEELSRVKLDSEKGSVYTRRLGGDLAETSFKVVDGLDLIPYIDGVEAGKPRKGSAKWLGRSLFVEDKPLAKLANAISEELGKRFQSDRITDAIKFCFDRSPAYVSEYMEEHFDLEPRILVSAPASHLGSTETVSPHGHARGAPSASPKDSPAAPDRRGDDGDRAAADRALELARNSLAQRVRRPRAVSERSSAAQDESHEAAANPRLEPPPLDEVQLTKIDLTSMNGSVREDRSGYPRSAGRSRSTAERQEDAEVGRWGEQLVVRYERERVRLLGQDERRVIWTADANSEADHDIRSVDADGGDLWIEVKSTVRRGRRFTWSVAEFEKAVRENARYAIYRVYEAYSTRPLLAVVRDPIALLAANEMHLEIEDFEAELPPMSSPNWVDVGLHARLGDENIMAPPTDQ